MSNVKILKYIGEIKKMNTKLLNRQTLEAAGVQTSVALAAALIMMDIIDT